MHWQGDNESNDADGTITCQDLEPLAVFFANIISLKSSQHPDKVVVIMTILEMWKLRLRACPLFAQAYSQLSGWHSEARFHPSQSAAAPSLYHQAVLPQHIRWCLGERWSSSCNTDTNKIHSIHSFLSQTEGLSLFCGVTTESFPHTWTDLLPAWAHVGDILIAEAGLRSAPFHRHSRREGSRT